MYTCRDVLGYCALGDSLTVGVGSTFFVKGFITRYLYLTRQTLKRPIAPVVFGKIGATSADIANSLNYPTIIEGIKRSEIITITAGGNDLIDAAQNFLQTKNEKEFLVALDNCNKNLTTIVERIKSIKRDHPSYIIRMINLYDPFSDIPGTDKWVEAFNRSIERHSQSPIIKVANIHDLFAGKEEMLLANDHIHPNDHGYAIIADALHHLGYGEFDNIS